MIKTPNIIKVWLFSKLIFLLFTLGIWGICIADEEILPPVCVDSDYNQTLIERQKTVTERLDRADIFTIQDLRWLATEANMETEFAQVERQLGSQLLQNIIDSTTIAELELLEEKAAAANVLALYKAQYDSLQKPIKKEIDRAKTLYDLKELEESARKFRLQEYLEAKRDKIKRENANPPLDISSEILAADFGSREMVEWVEETGKDKTPSGKPKILAEKSTKTLLSRTVVNSETGENRKTISSGKVVVENNSAKKARGFEVNKKSIYPITVSSGSSCFKAVYAGDTCEFDIEYVGTPGKLSRTVVNFKVSGDAGHSDELTIDVVELPAEIIFSDWCFNGKEISRTDDISSIYDFVELYNGVTYVGTNNGVFYYNSNDNKNWVNAGLRGKQVYVLAVSFTTKGEAILYAVTKDNGIYRSWDNGAWQRINSGLNSPDIRTLLVVYSNKGPVIYAGTAEGVFASKDNGESWVKVNNGLQNRSIRVLYSVNDGGYIVLYVGTDGGVYQSINAGETWEAVSLANIQSCSLDSKEAWDILNSPNGSQKLNIRIKAQERIRKQTGLEKEFSWSKINVGMDAFCLRDMWELSRAEDYQECAIDSEILWKNATINHSFMKKLPAIRGEFWQEIEKRYPPYSSPITNKINWGEVDLENIPICSLHYSQGALYAGTKGAGLFKNSFDGKGWVKTDLVNTYICSITSIDDILYAAIFGVGIMTSRDAGASWHMEGDGLRNKGILTLKKVTHGETTSLYVGTNNGKIFKARI